MQTTTLIKLWMLTLLVIAVASITPAAAAQTWGRLANPGFANQRMKATLFFAGQARDGTIRYGNCDPGDDQGLRVVHPLDSAHLRWFESTAFRDVALNLMVQAGINVINMSSWGEDFLACAWVTGAAPMQTDPRAHDELFAAAAGKPLLIVPFLESRGGQYPWEFRGEFPQRPDGLRAPGTVSQITNLINRYLRNASQPQWADKWARVYDQRGEERYAVVIIHAGSNLLGNEDHAAFAAGFDDVAAQVFQVTGMKVGFLIDILPAGTGAPAVFKPSPEATGPYLRNSQSLLGIECFIPEIWFGSSDTAAVINWKRDFSRRWFETGIPFLMDVSPGYDAHLVFPGSVHYGFTAEWLCQLAQMTKEYGQAGMVYNAWNGYGESLAAMPTQEYGSLFYDWLRSLQYADLYAQKPDAPAPRNGTWACPYTLPEALQNVPVGGIIGLLPTTSVPFDAPLTIQKPCTIVAIGGSARIGQ